MRTAKSEKTEGQQDGARRTPSVHKTNYKRRYPIGAELVGENETHFRVWAPKAQRVDVVLEGRGADGAAPSNIFALEREEGGYFSGSGAIGVGGLYRFRPDGRKIFIPIRHRVLNQADRMGRRVLWIRSNSNGPISRGVD